MDGGKGSGIYKIIMGGMGILALTFLMTIISKQENSTSEAKADIAKLQEYKLDKMEYYNDRKDIMDYLHKISDKEDEIRNEIIAHELSTKKRLKPIEQQCSENYFKDKVLELEEKIKSKPIQEPKQPWEMK